MALVTISGYPCSGKTKRAKDIQDMLEKRSNLPVVIVNDELQNISKEAYDDATSEKSARASLYSAVTRLLSPDRIVIFDAMNYIKGYRYQLYCAARESRCRTCTIQIAAPADKCAEWNRQREGSQYTASTLENLISRYEEPSPFVRWDSPLITIPWSDLALPEDEIYDAIFASELKPPNQATNTSKTTSTDYLSLLDSTASAVISAVLAAQSNLPGGGTTNLSIPLQGTRQSTKVQLALPARHVTMPQLQRTKRQFITLQRQANREISEESIVEVFVKYLQDALH